MPNNVSYQYPPVMPTLYSPQAKAVTGLPQRAGYADYIRSQAQFLPQLYQERRLAGIEEERREEEIKRFGIAERERKRELILTAGATGARALAYKPVYEGFTKPILYERGAKPIAEKMFIDPARQIGGKVAGMFTPTPAPYEPVMPGVVRGTMQEAVYTPQGVMPDTGIGTTIGKGIGRAGEIAGKVAAPLTAGMTAGSMVRRTNVGEYMSKQVGGGEKEWDTGLGAGAGAAYGFAVGGPIGAGIGALSGAIFGYKKRGPCIIVTVCTSPDSPEVQTCREYRDKFLTDDEIRGYYILADQIVPIIKDNKELKEAVRAHFVDKFIDYAEISLGKKKEFSYPDSAEMSIRFINICRNIGKTVPRYVRENGEVV